MPFVLLSGLHDQGASRPDVVGPTRITFSRWELEGWACFVKDLQDLRIIDCERRIQDGQARIAQQAERF